MSEQEAEPTEPKVESPASAAIGGKYQLLARLGQGGMADVFLAVARGPLGFNKLVVLKRLRSNDEDEQALQMFLDEARLAARLKHPNIVDTYDVGQEVDSYFIAMEYLEGQPLSRVLKAIGASQRSVEPTVWVYVVAEALHGLHHAHELHDYDGSALRIVHRDVSPHNIFVTYEAEVKVVDFGIAKTALSIAHTESGLLRGKLGYMAPEQALRENIDRRADVFAMGVVLWEALSGRRAFEGDMAMMFAKLVQAEIPRLADVKPEIDSKLAAIVERALKKDPNDRYATAADMRDALLEYAHALAGAAGKNEVASVMASLFGDHRALIKREIEKQLAAVARSQPKEGGIWDQGKILAPYEGQGPSPSGDSRQQSASSSPVASGSLSPAFTATPDRESSPAPVGGFNRRAFAWLATIAAVAGVASWLVIRDAHKSPSPTSTLVEMPAEVPVAVVSPAAIPAAAVPPADAPPKAVAPSAPVTRRMTVSPPSPPSRVEQSSAIVRAFPTDSPPPPAELRGARRHSQSATPSTSPTAVESPLVAGAERANVPAAPAPRPGTIEPAKLAAATNAHRAEIQECLDRARAEHSDLQGKIVIQSTITPEGHALNATATNNMVGGARLQACILAAWRSWTFPPPAGGIPANVSRTFSFE
jgi:serine/threonine protein kinase